MRDGDHMIGADMAPGRGADCFEASGPATAIPSRRALLLPIVAIELYLNLTVAIFAWGPWQWPVVNGATLYAFLGIAHVSLLFGYLTAISRPGRGSRIESKPERLVLVGVVVGLALVFPTSKARTGSWIPDVLGGLADLASAYFESNEAAARAGGSPVEYARILVGPWLFMVLPLTIFYWPKLRPTLRFASVVSTLLFLAIYVARGTNKALADTVLLLPSLMLARYFAGTLTISRRRLWAGLGISGLLFTAFLAFFSSGNVARLGDGVSSDYISTIDLRADEDNALLQLLPADVRLGALGLSSYLTQGYYGLSLALEEPFVPMFGVGNSMFLYLNAASLLGKPSIEDMPYPVRTGEFGGWDAYANWSSIYPWIASDVSFPGTIVVVFLIGMLFAMAWRDTLRGENPFAVCVLAQLLIVLFYFPANNQVMQTGEAVSSFYGVLGLWLYARWQPWAVKGR